MVSWLEGVMGWLFNMDSTSQIKVWSASLVNNRWQAIAFKALFTDFICVSQGPPIQGLLVGLNVQMKLKCLLTFSDTTLGILISAMASWSYFCGPLKLVSLSDRMCFVWEIKRRKSKMNELVVRSSAICECMAYVVMQVKITPYRVAFAWFARVFFIIGSIIVIKRFLISF